MNGKELLSFQVNGDAQQVAVQHQQTLLEVLRDELDLTGTKRGCDDASCAACTVLVDGEPVLACVFLALLAEGAAVTTVENFNNDERLSALQSALVESGGLQCGYCTPGIIMTAAALVERGDTLTEAAARQALAGNLCRCTGYTPIVEAVREAAQRLQRSERISPPATVNPPDRSLS